MTPQEIQSLGDRHYLELVKEIKSGDAEKARFTIACLNYMRELRPEFQWALQQGVMHGWLTITHNWRYIIRVDVEHDYFT